MSVWVSVTKITNYTNKLNHARDEEQLKGKGNLICVPTTPKRRLIVKTIVVNVIYAGVITSAY